MLIVRTRFLMFRHFLDTTFRVACPIIKGPTPNPTSGETLGQVYTCMFSFYPYVQHNICMLECWSSIQWVSQEGHMRLLLHWYSHPFEYIKKYIPNKVMYVLNARKFLTMNNMLPKNTQPCFMTNCHNSSIWNSGVIRQ